MVTRGPVSVNASKQAAYDALLAACKDMDADVKYASAESFTVDGQSCTMWLQNRFSFRFYARIRDQHDGAVLLPDPVSRPGRSPLERGGHDWLYLKAVQVDQGNH